MLEVNLDRKARDPVVSTTNFLNITTRYTFLPLIACGQPEIQLLFLLIYWS